MCHRRRKSRASRGPLPTYSTSDIKIKFFFDMNEKIKLIFDELRILENLNLSAGDVMDWDSEYKLKNSGKKTIKF